VKARTVLFIALCCILCVLSFAFGRMSVTPSGYVIWRWDGKGLPDTFQIGAGQCLRELNNGYTIGPCNKEFMDAYRAARRPVEEIEEWVPCVHCINQ
jgi:hypothetical protein